MDWQRRTDVLTAVVADTVLACHHGQSRFSPPPTPIGFGTTNPIRRQLTRMLLFPVERLAGKRAEVLAAAISACGIGWSIEVLSTSSAGQTKRRFVVRVSRANHHRRASIVLRRAPNLIEMCDRRQPCTPERAIVSPVCLMSACEERLAADPAELADKPAGGTPTTVGTHRQEWFPAADTIPRLIVRRFSPTDSAPQMHARRSTISVEPRVERSSRQYAPTSKTQQCTFHATIIPQFAGAGTTLLVAERLGRNSIGIDLNPDYARMAANRIREDCPMFSQVEIDEGQEVLA